MGEVSARSDSISNCQGLEKVSGAGIEGTADPSQDYTYARMFDVALRLSKRYPIDNLLSSTSMLQARSALVGARWAICAD